MSGSWSDHADLASSRVFRRGEPAPAAQELRDAYPFGEREMWPYKVWLKRVKAWRLAHSLGLSSPSGRRVADPAERDHETIDAFAAARPSSTGGTET